MTGLQTTYPLSRQETIAYYNAAFKAWAGYDAEHNLSHMTTEEIKKDAECYKAWAEELS